MANKIFSSIIDEFLADREPEWGDVGLKDAEKSGEKVEDRTHQYVDKKFMDEIAEGASKHTPLPSDSKSATLLNRLAEQEAAAPRLSSGQIAKTHLGARPQDYKNPIGDDASLFDEVTMNLSKAESSADIQKRNRTDSEIKSYVHKLLNQGTPPAHITAQLEKMAELELLDKKDNMGASYLNQNAGLLGLSYLEPNAFMDKNSPTYERETPKVGSEEKPFCQNCRTDVTPKMRDAVALCPECLKPLSLKPKQGSIGKQADNWQPVTGTPFNAECEGCHQQKLFGDAHSDKDAFGRLPDEVRGGAGGFANLEGTPWKAYLCNECMAKRRRVLYSSADCVRQHDAWKAAGIVPRAKSVKKVAACEGCTYFKNKTCGLYRLPVVANAAELAPIVNRLTAGIPAEHKRAALVKIANRQPERAEGLAMTTAPARPVIKASERTIESLRTGTPRDGRHQASTPFDAATVERLHKAGHELEKIYRAGIRKSGSVQAGRAIKQFIASLRDRGTKISLSQIDCRFLKAKLAVSNAILGAVKCGDCAYRQDMHCGLTGGTLLGFPGMDKTGKTASAPPEDAAALLKDYELTGRPSPQDIDISEPERLEVEMSSKPSAGNL